MKLQIPSEEPRALIELSATELGHIISSLIAYTEFLMFDDSTIIEELERNAYMQDLLLQFQHDMIKQWKAEQDEEASIRAFGEP